MKDKLTNITRYTYDRTAFQGWRLCLTRKGHIFCKYFSDVSMGGSKKALKAALAMRKAIKAALRCAGADPQEVFARFKEGKMTPQKGGEA